MDQKIVNIFHIVSSTVYCNANISCQIICNSFANTVSWSFFVDFSVRNVEIWVRRFNNYVFRRVSQDFKSCLNFTFIPRRTLQSQEFAVKATFFYWSDDDDACFCLISLNKPKNSERCLIYIFARTLVLLDPWNLLQPNVLLKFHSKLQRAPC